MIPLGVITALTVLALVTPMLTRPTLPFGVRVAAERVKDPAIVAQRRVYFRFVLLAGLLAVIVTVLGQPNTRVIAVALGVVDMLLYYMAYRRVRAIKRKEWWQAEHRYGVTVDTTFRANPVRVPWPWLTPAVLVLLATSVVGWQYSLEPVLAQGVVTLLSPLVAFLVLRAKPDLDAARPKASARRYRVYLRGVARMLLLLTTAVNLKVMVDALVRWEMVPRTTFWTVAAYVPLAVGLLAFLLWEIRVGQAGHRLPALPGEEEENTGVVQRDDDKHWFLAGMIYANRHDPALLVHRRVGAYWTLNLGHPVAWLVVGVVAMMGALSGVGVIDLHLQAK